MGGEIGENRENYIMRSFIILIPHHILHGVIKLIRVTWTVRIARIGTKRMHAEL
jgi:hypothetical protein